MTDLTLLHSELPQLRRVLAVLSTIQPQFQITVGNLFTYHERLVIP